jgi:hypothetical protein
VRIWSNTSQQARRKEQGERPDRLNRLYNVTRPLVVDLFSGAGGTGLGFRSAGFRILVAIELNPHSAATYENNLHDVGRTMIISWNGKTHHLREGGMKATPVVVLPLFPIATFRADKKNKAICKQFVCVA